MKLGIFDSGLGGLLITRAVHQRMPDLDILYYGDTLRLPYGNRSEETITQYTQSAMDYMFGQGCSLVVIACNTASATTLRKLQQEWLPGRHKKKNILGVVVPTLEEASAHGYKKLGLIGTNYSVRSNVYEEELRKINPDIKIIQKATPLLVPLIENDGMKWAEDVLRDYLTPLLKHKIEGLILGCTHYPLLKNQIQKIVGNDVELLSQDDIVPGKLEDYLRRHPEYKIGRSGQAEFFVSDVTDNYIKAAQMIYGADIKIQKAAA